MWYWTCLWLCAASRLNANMSCAISMLVYKHGNLRQFHSNLDTGSEMHRYTCMLTWDDWITSNMFTFFFFQISRGHPKLPASPLHHPKTRASETRALSVLSAVEVELVEVVPPKCGLTMDMSMENPPFEDLFPIENGDIQPLPCWFTRGCILFTNIYKST